MIKKYNKLIRDRIPEKMDKNGATYEVVELDDSGYKIELMRKMGEEYGEVKDAYANLLTNDSRENRRKLLMELADLQQCLNSFLSAADFTPEELEDVRQKKEIENGGFEKRLFLKAVTIPDPAANEAQ